MNHTRVSAARVRQILAGASRTRVLVLGDAMLDHFVRGSVARISPEAPVPVVDFEGENFMPGGAANVARNLTALQVPTELLGAVGHDPAASQLKGLLNEYALAAGVCSTCRAVPRASRRASSPTSSRSSGLTAKHATGLSEALSRAAAGQRCDR